MNQPLVQAVRFGKLVDFPEDSLQVQWRTGNPGAVIDVLAGDAVSGFHSPSNPNRIFDYNGTRLTGGQVVSRILQEVFANPPDHESLGELLVIINQRIDMFLSMQGIGQDRPDDRPATDVAAARITDQTIEMIQVGDCFAAWLMNDGTICGTDNQAQTFDQMLGPIRQRLKEQGANVWDAIEPDFRRGRHLYTNKPRGEGGYSTLNGQPEASQIWDHRELPRDQVKLLLLFTDGLVRDEHIWDSPARARHLIETYQQGGWRAVVDNKDRHINEGSGVAVEF